MTAFGRSEEASTQVRVTVEIRSVNHRYRDLSMRLPRALQPLEEEIKSMVASRVGRGRVELSLELQAGGEESDYEVSLNVPLARAYSSAIKRLQEEVGVNLEARADTFLQVRDMITVRPVERDLEADRPVVLGAVSGALEELDRMRLQEGGALEADLRARIAAVKESLKLIEERAPAVVEEFRRRLKERVEALSQDLEVDDARLAQEAAIFAGKCDVTEEVVRGRSHLDQFEGYLSVDEPVGRRLDFLIQELHREVNTISSKASDAAVSSVVVEIKGELEKLREQVQNVE
jgi:uncharacterized protein (TIGR00255 family)